MVADTIAGLTYLFETCKDEICKTYHLDWEGFKALDNRCGILETIEENRDIFDEYSVGDGMKYLEKYVQVFIATDEGLGILDVGTREEEVVDNER